METTDHDSDWQGGWRASATEITARDLLDVLARDPSKPLVFIYDGETVRPGYHVTEVKTGRFTALDCGANFEAWTETFIQLWDVDDGDRTHMTAGKFVAIIDKVEKVSSFDADTKLTFEVSDGEQAMRLFKAAGMQIDDHRIVVTLARRPAAASRATSLAGTGAADTSMLRDGGTDASVLRGVDREASCRVQAPSPATAGVCGVDGGN